jgi:hypothetical protein
MRKAALAMSSKEKRKNENYRPGFSSERAPHITKSVPVTLLQIQRSRVRFPGTTRKKLWFWNGVYSAS